MNIEQQFLGTQITVKKDYIKDISHLTCLVQPCVTESIIKNDIIKIFKISSIFFKIVLTFKNNIWHTNVY